MHKLLGFEDGQVAESSFVHPQENVLQSDNSFVLNATFMFNYNNNSLIVDFPDMPIITRWIPVCANKTGTEIAALLQNQFTLAGLLITVT